MWTHSPPRRLLGLLASLWLASGLERTWQASQVQGQGPLLAGDPPPEKSSLAAAWCDPTRLVLDCSAVVVHGHHRSAQCHNYWTPCPTGDGAAGLVIGLKTPITDSDANTVGGLFTPHALGPNQGMCRCKHSMIVGRHHCESDHSEPWVHGYCPRCGEEDRPTPPAEEDADTAAFWLHQSLHERACPSCKKAYMRAIEICVQTYVEARFYEGDSPSHTAHDDAVARRIRGAPRLDYALTQHRGLGSGAGRVSNALLQDELDELAEYQRLCGRGEPPPELPSIQTWRATHWASLAAWLPTEGAFEEHAEWLARRVYLLYCLTELLTHADVPGSVFDVQGGDSARQAPQQHGRGPWRGRPSLAFRTPMRDRLEQLFRFPPRTDPAVTGTVTSGLGIDVGRQLVRQIRATAEPTHAPAPLDKLTSVEHDFGRTPRVRGDGSPPHTLGATRRQTGAFRKLRDAARALRGHHAEEETTRGEEEEKEEAAHLPRTA